MDLRRIHLFAMLAWTASLPMSGLLMVYASGWLFAAAWAWAVFTCMTLMIGWSAYAGAASNPYNNPAHVRRCARHNFTFYTHESCLYCESERAGGREHGR